MNLLVIQLLLSTILSQCTKTLIRKEIRELNPEELQRYFSALHKMHSKQNDEESIHDAFSRIHFEARNYTHGFPALLPWHREFIKGYERELQKIDPLVTMPYWDWTLDYKDPQISPIFTMGFGGNGLKSKNYCIQNGQFANWTMKYPNTHCLRRDFYEEKKMDPFASPESIVALLYKDQPYSSFIQELEVHHSDVHVNIGGFHGDMLPHTSPNDPLFYLHHGFMDLLWYNWQKINPKRAKEYNGKGPLDVLVKTSDVLFPFDISVEDTLDTENNSRYCYKYSDYLPFRPPKSTYKPDTPIKTTTPPPTLKDAKTPALQTLNTVLSNNKKALDNVSNPDPKFIGARVGLINLLKPMSALKIKYMESNKMNVTLGKDVEKKGKLLDVLVKNDKSNNDKSKELS